jgi:hypothetical protein
MRRRPTVSPVNSTDLPWNSSRITMLMALRRSEEVGPDIRPFVPSCYEGYQSLDLE